MFWLRKLAPNVSWNVKPLFLFCTIIMIYKPEQFLGFVPGLVIRRIVKLVFLLTPVQVAQKVLLKSFVKHIQSALGFFFSSIHIFILMHVRLVAHFHKFSIYIINVIYQLLCACVCLSTNWYDIAFFKTKAKKNGGGGLSNK